MGRISRQRVVRNHLIAVTLAKETEATVVIRAPSTKVTQEPIDVSALLAGGMSEAEALDFVTKVVGIGVLGSGTTV